MIECFLSLNIQTLTDVLRILVKKFKVPIKKITFLVSVYCLKFELKIKYIQRLGIRYEVENVMFFKSQDIRDLGALDNVGVLYFFMLAFDAANF